MSASEEAAKMSKAHKGQGRGHWAHLRFSIVGALLAAPPPPGELQQALVELAAKTWRHPTNGLPLRFGVSTIQRWYYLARRAGQDPVGALTTKPRVDIGHSRVVLSGHVQAIAAQYKAHPSWSYQLHYDNLAAIPGLPVPLPSYATVRRHMKAHGQRKQPRARRINPTAGMLASEQRRQGFEMRSYEVDHVHGLWHADFHQCSRTIITPGGEQIIPRLLGVLDDRSRVACHAQWFADETTRSLVHGLNQAFQRRAMPRALLTDNGAAMLAEEFGCGMHTLGIMHHTTLPYTPEANGKQEHFWAGIEGRLMAMLEGVEHLSLALLNEATLAWVEHDYHRALHSELGTTPLARYLEGPDVGRESPSSDALRAAFRLEVVRRQRHTDGTFSLEGRRFEIPSRYRTLERVRVRYARWDLSRVDLLDPHSGAVLCALYPLDKSANANAQRRALVPVDSPPGPLPSSGMAPLLRKIMAEYAATGHPPAYLPTESEL